MSGLRERKKAATRKVIADTALRLFLERGYEEVGLREIAEAADVSVTTLFNYFPGGKESLVFDEDAAHEAALVAAVTGRPPGQSVAEALRAHMTAFALSPTGRHPGFPDFRALVQGNAPLREYARVMWTRHEDALARALAAEAGRPPGDLTCAAFAHFAVEILAFSAARDDPPAAIDAACALLDRGWSAVTAA